jgi:hypothetical protein
MDVAHQFEQVGITVAENRLVAALKQMADLFVAAVVALGMLPCIPCMIFDSPTLLVSMRRWTWLAINTYA